MLDGEIFHGLAEIHILIATWQPHYNGVRPHSSLCYQAPAPECFVPRSGIVPWAGSPVLEGARATTSTLASEPSIH
jgi:putative transposase